MLTIAGLGPGNADLVTRGTERLLREAPRVILRTRHHPAVRELAGSDAWEDCDDLYASGSSFDDVYDAIAQRVVDAARDGDVVYAVPGSPFVAEDSVARVLALADEAEIAAQVEPAMSYVDAVASSLRIDLGDIQLCDALDLRLDAERPALISQLFDRDTVSALKLALLDIYPADHQVTVVRSAGTAEASVRSLALAELDHGAYSYLDSLYVPALGPYEDLRRFDGLHAVVTKLNAPDGCPWDREQTHQSLRPHLLEEAYEALQALDANDPHTIAEEMGDVLLQVLMHTAVGEREGTFGLGDVTEAIGTKLIRRHPHVFGDAEAKTAGEVWQSWEALKQAERPSGSMLDGVPVALPALAASQSMQGRARRIGFDWPDVEGPLEKLVEEVREFADADAPGDREEEFGDILFVLANIGQRLGIDGEHALRAANAKFRERFGIMERLAAERGITMKGRPLEELDALWDEAKAQIAAERSRL